MITIAFFVSLADTAQQHAKISPQVRGRDAGEIHCAMGRAGAAKVPVITAFVCRQWGAFMHDAKHGDLAATHSRFVRPKLPATSASAASSSFSSAPSAPEDDSAVAPLREGGRAKAFSLNHT